jgi:enterochelin esterase-like enzyme
MDLTGGVLLTLVAVIAVAAPVATLLLWSRVRGVSALRDGQRLALIALCQFSAVTLTAVVLNDQFTFYESWADLVGQNAQQGGTVQSDPAGVHGVTPVDPSISATTHVPELGPIPGTGRILHEQVRGPHSGVSAKIWVLLPEGYDQAANRERNYPVVMFLPGYPGTPTTWLHALDLERVMDAEVVAGHVQPFIAVLPTMNVAAPRDTECADVPGGPQVDTWLGTDVPQIVHAQTRSLPPGVGWGVTGYSTGGFCAAKLVLRHPESFRSGAVLSGYFSPSVDVTTGDLYGGSLRLKQQNDPQWLVSHQPTPESSLLTVWSAQDPETAVPTQTFLRSVRPPLRADEIRLARGGHNTDVWLGVLPLVLRWLSSHVHA